MTIAMPNRRTFLGALAFAGAGIIPARAAGETVDVAALMAPQPLPDLWIGSPEARTVVIEYASMTCSHCAAFEAESWPSMKREWIDAGKVRYALREFPLDPLSAAAAMLARSRGDKRQEAVELLFAKQNDWAFVEKPVDSLAAVVAQIGINRDEFDRIMRDQAAYDAINKMREHASKEYHVSATPTFFVNGVKHQGEVKPDELKNVFG